MRPDDFLELKSKCFRDLKWWTLRDSKNGGVTITPNNTPINGGFNTL